LLDRLKKEGKETKADVLWGFGITHLLDYELEYGLADYKPKGVENIEEAIKHDFTDNLGQWYIDPVYQKQKSAGVLPKWVGITAYMNVFCVNEAKMKDEYPDWTPEDLTWENFIKPECGVGEGVG